MRIHVTEEARHIKFAREGVVRRMETAGRVERLLTGNLVGLGGPVFRYAFSNPAVYRRAGLDPKRACREAADNPHLRESADHGLRLAGAVPHRERTARAGRTPDVATGGVPRMRLKRRRRQRPDPWVPEHDDDDGYRGPAQPRTSANDTIDVEVVLGGHLEPLDGRYHWYGRVVQNDAVDAAKQGGATTVGLTIADGVQCRGPSRRARRLGQHAHHRPGCAAVRASRGRGHTRAIVTA